MRYKCALILSHLDPHLCWRSIHCQEGMEVGPCKEVLRASSSLAERANYQCAPAMTEMNGMDTCSLSRYGGRHHGQTAVRITSVDEPGSAC